MSGHATASSFARAYRRYWGFVRSTLQRQRVPSADLDDVAQEVFVVFLRRLGPNASPDGVRAWLYEVSRRVASNHRRRSCRHARRRPLATEPVVTPEDNALRRESIEALCRFVEDLPPIDREVFVMSELEDKPGRVIAECLDLPLHMIYRKIRALRRSLAQALGIDPPRSKRKWMLVAGPWRAMAPTLAAAAFVLCTGHPAQVGREPRGRATTPVTRTHRRSDDTQSRTRGDEPSSKTAIASPRRAPAPASRDRRPPRKGLSSEAIPGGQPLFVPPAWKLPPSLTPSVPPRVPTQPVRQTVEEPLTWRGRFVDEKGEPIANALVYCRRLAGHGVRRRCLGRSAAKPRTDDQGYVEVGPLTPGTYELVTFERGARTTGSPLARVVINRPENP